VVAASLKKKVKCYFIPFGLKYAPQHPVLKYRQYDTSSFKLVFKNKNKYISVFINLRTFLANKLEDTTYCTNRDEVEGDSFRVITV
jgi:hypothetical protein